MPRPWVKNQNPFLKHSAEEEELQRLLFRIKLPERILSLIDITCGATAAFNPKFLSEIYPSDYKGKIRLP